METNRTRWEGTGAKTAHTMWAMEKSPHFSMDHEKKTCLTK